MRMTKTGIATKEYTSNEFERPNETKANISYKRNIPTVDNIAFTLLFSTTKYYN